MAAGEIKSLTFTQAKNAELIKLINEFAKAERLKPHTAIERYLRQHLPQEIERIRKNDNSVGGS